jgi:hypothetical protein
MEHYSRGKLWRRRLKMTEKKNSMVWGRKSDAQMVTVYVEREPVETKTTTIRLRPQPVDRVTPAAKKKEGDLILTPAAVRRLAEEIASAAEKSYRRGFQHGTHFDTSDEDAAWYRHAGQRLNGRYSGALPAPENGVRYSISKHRGGLVERLRMETSDAGHPLLAEIFRRWRK